MKYTLEDAYSSIVLLGNFNPLIFKPHWFADHEILGSDDAEHMKEDGVEILSQEVVVYRLNWLELVVTKDRFSAKVTEDPVIRLYDLTVNTFSHLLHTPVHTIGFNRSVDWTMSNVDKWHELGDMLAPKGPWEGFVDQAGGVRNGGLRELVIEQKPRDDGCEGHVQVRVRPVVSRLGGVSVAVNDQFIAGSPMDVAGAEKALKLITNNWEDSMNRSNALIERVMGLV